MRLRAAIATTSSLTSSRRTQRISHSISGTGLSYSGRSGSAHRRLSFRWCENRAPCYSARNWIYRKILYQKDGPKHERRSVFTVCACGDLLRHFISGYCRSDPCQATTATFISGSSESASAEVFQMSWQAREAIAVTCPVRFDVDESRKKCAHAGDTMPTSIPATSRSSTRFESPVTPRRNSSRKLMRM